MAYIKPLVPFKNIFFFSKLKVQLTIIFPDNILINNLSPFKSSLMYDVLLVASSLINSLIEGLKDSGQPNL